MNEPDGANNDHVILTPSPLVSNDDFSFPSIDEENSSFRSVSFSDESSDCTFEPNKRKPRYEILQQIGKGGMGRVYLALDTKLQEHVAVKKVLCESTGDVNRAMAEVWPVRQLKHEHLVEYKEVFFEALENAQQQTSNGTDPEERFAVCIVMDYFSQGDLSAEIVRRAQTQDLFDPLLVLEYMLQLTSALEHLHNRNLMHRDIKPLNIFMSQKGLKLGDFGLVKNMEHTEAKTTAGTHRYMAPEIFRKNGVYSLKADVWSLGVLFLEMMCLGINFMPYLEVYMNRQFYNEIERTMLNNKYPPKLVDLVVQCLGLEEHGRPSANQLYTIVLKLWDERERLFMDDDDIFNNEYAPLFSAVLDANAPQLVRIQAWNAYRDKVVKCVDKEDMFDLLAKHYRYFQLVKEILKLSDSESQTMAYMILASVYQFTVKPSQSCKLIRTKFADGGSRSILGIALHHDSEDVRNLAKAVCEVFTAVSWNDPSDQILFKTLGSIA